MTRYDPDVTRRPWLLLGALLAALGLVVAIWTSMDRRPPMWDYANHLERALQCYRILAEPGHDRLREILEATSFYPPVTTCAAGLLYLVFPVVPLTAQAVMLGFLALGMASVFLLGRRLLGTEAGLLAAFLLATAPFVVFSLTNFQLDVPLMGIVALSLYVLARTEGFSLTGWSLAFGVAAGIGLLTKPPFVVYLLPPLLLVIWQAIRSNERRRRLAHVAASMVIAAGVALPWYGPRLLGLPLQIMNRSFKNAAFEQKPETFSPEGLLYYPRMFPVQFGLLAVLLFLWGIWAVRRERAARAFLWVSALGPFVVFSLIQNKNLRYTLPILPATALIAAAGARGLGPRIRRGVTWAVVGLGALQVSMTAFALPAPPALPWVNHAMVIAWPPDPADWQQARVLEDIARESRGQAAAVAVVPNEAFFSVSNFRYETELRRLPFQMMRPWSGPPLGVDFIVLKSGSQGPAWTAAKPERITRAFDGGDPYLAAIFPVVGEYALPDGSRGTLRARRIAPLEGATAGTVAQRLETAPERFLAANMRDAVGLRASFDYRPEALLRGEADRARIRADSAVVGELSRRDRAPLRVRDLDLEIEGLLFNPQRLMATGALEILDARALRIRHLTITQEDLQDLLRGQPIGAGMSVELGDGSAGVLVTRFGPTLSARVRPVAGSDAGSVALAVDNVRVAGLRVPGGLVEWITRHFDPTLALRRLPVPVALAPIRVKPGRIEIGEQ